MEGQLLGQRLRLCLCGLTLRVRVLGTFSRPLKLAPKDFQRSRMLFLLLRIHLIIHGEKVDSQLDWTVVVLGGGEVAESSNLFHFGIEFTFHVADAFLHVGDEDLLSAFLLGCALEGGNLGLVPGKAGLAFSPLPLQFGGKGLDLLVG